ncbi:MAG: hypothetical protein ACREMT_11625, partial [Vulcanimicrobiaceae bacterium]
MTELLRRRAFGAVAETYLPYLGDLPVIVISDEQKTARDELLDARRKGLEFATMPLLGDARTTFAIAAAKDVCSQVTDYDHRRFYFEAIHTGDINLRGRLLRDFSDDPEGIGRLAEIVRLSTTVVARSFVELARIERVVCPVAANVALWHPQRELPYFERRAGNDIVIWAPDHPGGDLAIAVFALEQYHGKVTLVAATPLPFAARAEYLAPGDSAVSGALATASCVLDATLSDPGWAYAFTAKGIPVAAAATSGAREVADGVST